MWAGSGIEEPPDRKRLLIPVLGASVALVLAVVVAWIVFGGDGETTGTTAVSAPTGTTERSGDKSGAKTTGDTTPSSTGAPVSPATKRQAQAVNAILTDSGGTRSGLGPALQQVRDCDRAQTGIATIQRITDARAQQVAKVDGLAIDAIANGQTLKSRLTTALNASLEADRRFLAWARRHATDCTADLTRDPDYQRGVASSTKATTAKKSFLKLWNPLARQHSLPTRAVNEI